MAGLVSLAVSLQPERFEFIEHAVGMAGSIAMVAGHILNRRLRICSVAKD